MTTSTRIGSIVLAAVVLLAVAVPVAAGDDWARQAASDPGYGPLDPAIQVAVNAHRDRLDPAIATALAAHFAREAREASGSSQPVQTPVAVPTNNFDWVDAGIGAGAAGLAALLVALASLIGVRRSRGHLRSA